MLSVRKVGTQAVHISAVKLTKAFFLIFQLDADNEVKVRSLFNNFDQNI